MISDFSKQMDEVYKVINGVVRVLETAMSDQDWLAVGEVYETLSGQTFEIGSGDDPEETRIERLVAKAVKKMVGDDQSDKIVIDTIDIEPKQDDAEIVETETVSKSNEELGSFDGVVETRERALKEEELPKDRAARDLAPNKVMAISDESDDKRSENNQKKAENLKKREKREANEFEYECSSCGTLYVSKVPMPLSDSKKPKVRGYCDKCLRSASEGKSSV